MIRQKQSLVHKVPNGVAILSHVCGVAAIVLHTPCGVCVWKIWGDKEFLSLISGK